MVRVGLQLYQKSGLRQIPSFLKEIMAGRDINNFRKHYAQGQGNLKVLLDMDQVLCDFEKAFLDTFREKYPDDPFIPLEDRRTFYLNDQYSETYPDIAPKVPGIWNAKGFFKSLPEIEGAVAAAKEMAQMKGVDVFICTSPTNFYKYCVTEKFQWVDKHLGPDWVRRIIIAKDKTMVFGHLLIDDKSHITGANTYPTWEHVLFTSCHNKHVEGKRRLNNWTDGTWRDLIEDFKKKI